MVRVVNMKQMLVALWKKATEQDEIITEACEVLTGLGYPPNPDDGAKQISNAILKLLEDQ